MREMNLAGQRNYKDMKQTLSRDLLVEEDFKGESFDEVTSLGFAL